VTDFCPVLNAELSTLRPLVAEHAVELFAILKDVELWRYTETAESSNVWFAKPLR
jgi:hypothetical protein